MSQPRTSNPSLSRTTWIEVDCRIGVIFEGGSNRNLPASSTAIIPVDSLMTPVDSKPCHLPFGFARPKTLPAMLSPSTRAIAYAPVVSLGSGSSVVRPVCVPDGFQPKVWF
jgi:hypothetical protein